MAAILYYPWWDIRVVHRFQRSDFSPSPRIDCVLLRIQLRAVCLIPNTQKDLYQDFVAYHFTRDRFAKYAPPFQWLKLSQRSKFVKESFSRLMGEQKNLHKVHRTRTDKNWKKFK